jgi:translation initiation factor 1
MLHELTNMSKHKDNRKDREGIVYSTNPDFHYNHNEEQEQETLPPSKQEMRVSLNKKIGGGKQATLITGFVGTESDLKELGKTLRVKCGVGGSAKDGEILIQGDLREKITKILLEMGYKTKRAN